MYKTKINEEFHVNGKLAYTETIAILIPAYSHLFENKRIHPDGYEWIRIGKCAKYFDNGQLSWQINYDEKGNALKDNSFSFRKDGSVIQY